MEDIKQENFVENQTSEMRSSDKKREKKKKKGGGQFKKAVALGLVFTVVGCGGAYAWFTLSNKAKVENLTLLADHQGNLKIADDLGSAPGEYSDTLDLVNAKGGSELKDKILSPVTTKNGREFYVPVYDTGNGATSTVEDVSKIENADDLKKYYIFEKSFYLKAGSDDDNDVVKIEREYKVALYGSNGSYICQNDGSGKPKRGEKNSAANAIRVSFTIGEGANAQTAIYEPNYDVVSDRANKANASSKLNGYGSFSEALQQNKDGKFKVESKPNESEVMFTIPEDQNTKVTMRIWIEGTDDDCINEIAANQLVGQIQFVSTEIKKDKDTN